MKKFLLLYVGKAPKFNELTPEQVNSVLSTWGQWEQSIGTALVDKGTMIADDVELMDNGEMLEPLQVNGYSIIQAEDMPGALKLAHEHPFLGRNEGKYSVVILELMSGLPAASPSPTQTQPTAVTPAEPVAQATQQPVSPAQVIVPQQQEEPAPPREPGELTIPHEQPSDEQLPPAPPAPPNPS